MSTSPLNRSTVQTLLSEQGSTLTKDAKALVTKVAREYKGKVSGMETGTLHASLATYAAEQSGILPVKGTRVPGGEGGDMMTGQAYAALFGVQSSSVTAWRTLGYAVCVVGVDPDEESTDTRMSSWRLLAFKGAATNKAVSEAVYAEGATVESVRAAIESVRDSATGKVKGSRKGSPNKSTGTEGDLTAAIKADPEAVALAVIRDVLRPASAACNTEQWSKVEDAINALLHRELTIRNGKASAESKAAAESALEAVTPAEIVISHEPATVEAPKATPRRRARKAA